jgi:hypothetical protein
MNHKQIKAYARSFRRGLLGKRTSTNMCYMVTAPLTTLLCMAGVSCKLVEGWCGAYHHFFIELEDGHILDPTADQFKDMGLPQIYLGPAKDIYRHMKEP